MALYQPTVDVFALGSVTPFGTLDFKQQLYLGITFASGSEMTPRYPLSDHFHSAITEDSCENGRLSLPGVALGRMRAGSHGGCDNRAHLFRIAQTEL